MKITAVEDAYNYGQQIPKFAYAEQYYNKQFKQK